MIGAALLSKALSYFEQHLVDISFATVQLLDLSGLYFRPSVLFLSERLVSQRNGVLDSTLACGSSVQVKLGDFTHSKLR